MRVCSKSGWIDEILDGELERTPIAHTNLGFIDQLRRREWLVGFVQQAEHLVHRGALEFSECARLNLLPMELAQQSQRSFTTAEAWDTELLKQLARLLVAEDPHVRLAYPQTKLALSEDRIVKLILKLRDLHNPNCILAQTMWWESIASELLPGILGKLLKLQN